MTTSELIAYYQTAILPQTALLPSCKVSDVKKMVAAHMRYVVGAKSKKFAKPYKDRLIELKQYIEQNNEK